MHQTSQAMPGMSNMPGMDGMNGMHNMPMTGGLPEWLLVSLAVMFLGCTVFYLYRLAFSGQVRAAYGYYDRENEVGHMLCVAGMVTMLAPALLPISATAWAVVLGLGAAWFLVRSFTWGLKLAHNWWGWDLIHVGMLGFMALMYVGIQSVILTWVASVFWVYFIGYALVWAVKTRTAKGGFGSFFEFGSDFAHISMGIVMLGMTVFPDAFMPAMMQMAM